MLDIGWSELMVIGVLALLVVGPKELPRLMRTVGQFVGKARGLARDFQRSMEDAAREADLNELTDLKRDVEKMGKVDFKSQATRSANSLMTGGKPKPPEPASVSSEKAVATPDPAAPEATKPAPEIAKPAEPAKPAKKSAKKPAQKPVAAESAPTPTDKPASKTAAGDA